MEEAHKQAGNGPSQDASHGKKMHVTAFEFYRSLLEPFVVLISSRNKWGQLNIVNNGMGADRLDR